MKRKRMLDAGESSSNGSSSRQAGETHWETSILRTILERAADFHNASTSIFQELIGQIKNEIEKAIEALQSPEPGSDSTSIINSLKDNIANLAPKHQLESVNNGTQASLDMFLMLLNCFFYSDISKAYMQNKRPDPQIVNDILANYLYRNNHFETGDAFIREAGIPEFCTLRSYYKEMHEILKALRDHNAFPAIDWIHKINHGYPELVAPRLEFELYSQQYLEMLKSDADPLEAIKFMRMHLTLFDSMYQDEIKKLAGCALWTGRLDESPYADLLLSSKWDKLANDFTEKCLGLLGQPVKCHLTTVCNVGARNLPLLFSLHRIVGDKKEWESIDSLSLHNETDVGERCNFHSIFVCQKCRETATDPPLGALSVLQRFIWNGVCRFISDKPVLTS
ncbi:Protein RMD5-like protein A [Rhynchospora pubera]|uniref:Protein RMD5-like protein A n=1 Tax=Rhynchospora pubera TaxID=906938 RepID=A0AAV8FQA2_9POAL|nr:Protein RMD5-like protein A [Rhynchospora pubera]